VKQRTLSRISLCAALAAVACVSLVSMTLAQDEETNTLLQANQERPKPMFAALPPRYLENLLAPSSPTVTYWSGSFSTGGTVYRFDMVGTNPATTDSSTTVTAYVIPIKVTCVGHTYDPEHLLLNRRSVVENVTESPIFNAGIDFVQGGTSLGNTQYVDAFQRGNFWSDVKTNTKYHVLLSSAIVLPEQALAVPGNYCSIGNPFGLSNVGIVNIHYFDAKLQSIISGMSQITPSSLAIALTYDLYLSENSGLSECCIGGYHSAFGSSSAPQTYAYATYIPVVGKFSEDVAALSHEVGEWTDDPFVNNPAPSRGGCHGILEVGDPLVLHDYPYTLNGFTYHLRDLVFLDYFSGNNSLQVNGWYSFQHEKAGGQCS
jgi:hypothetical protein